MAAVLTCLADLKMWMKIMKFMAPFVLIFTIMILYLKLSSYTNTWAVIVFSSIVSLIFTFLCKFFQDVRIALYTAPLQIASPPGTLMAMMFLSWLLVQDVLESFLLVQEDLSTPICSPNISVSNQTAQVESKLIWINTIMPFLSTIPLFGIIGYSLAYEITYYIRIPKKNRHGEDVYDFPRFGKFVRLGRYMLTCMTGVTFGTAVALHFIKSVLLKTAAMAASSEACRLKIENVNTGVQVMPIWLYLVFCGVIFFMAAVSDIILKGRGFVIDMVKDEDE